MREETCALLLFTRSSFSLWLPPQASALHVLNHMSRRNVRAVNMDHRTRSSTYISDHSLTSAEKKQNEIDKLAVQLKFEAGLKDFTTSLKKEQHNQRLKSLRETADQLKDDSWLYPAPNAAIERLLSL